MDFNCDGAPHPSPDSCPNSRCDTSDFRFVETGVWDDFDSGCSGGIFSMKSIDTIRKLKTPSAIDFSKPLVIYDTSQFPLVDGRSPWHVDCPYFANPCPKRSWSLPSPVWYLGKTHEKNYFLFRFVSRQTIRQGERNREFASISYILQTDGSLNFKDAPVAVLNSERQARASHNQGTPLLTKQFGTPSNIQRYDRVYDVCGRLLNASSDKGRGANRASMIYFVKKANSRNNF